MKKIFAMILSLVLLVACTSCSKKQTIELPFSATDVTNIEMYRYNVPAVAQQKILVSPDDFTAIIEMLTSIDVGKNDLDSVAGSDVTSLRFILADGTDFEIIYISHGVKKGEIKSSYVFDYQTSSDVGSIWSNYGENPKSVTEDVLPTYEK